MAVVYFAGHGIELGGENWLIPTDAELKTDLDTEREAISLRSVMLMVSSASKLGVVMLDACRNNPFLNKVKRSIATRAVGRGLSRVEPMNNVLVAYAAKDGTTASDGAGRNSPFTTRSPQPQNWKSETTAPGRETVQRKKPDGAWVTIPKSHTFAECARNMRNLGYIDAAARVWCGPNGSVTNGK